MTVEPIASSTLAFECDGIIEQVNAGYGYAVANGFDVSGMYTMLEQYPHVAGDTSRLEYGWKQLTQYIGAAALATLRAEDAKMRLNRAIDSRQNVFLSRYGSIQDIVARITDDYSITKVTSKARRLEELAHLSQTQFELLLQAYTNDHRHHVQRTTQSLLTSDTDSWDTQHDESFSDHEEVTVEASAISVGQPPLPAPSPGDYIAESAGLPGSEESDISRSVGVSHENGREHTREVIVNTDYTYRTPYIENEARNLRAQISLIDESFSQFMSGVSIPHMTKILTNEQDAIDADVYRMQIAYLSTILVSPIAGTVTRVFKYPGEYVQAGDPVLRVDQITGKLAGALVFASITYSGAIDIGTHVTITTKEYGPSGASVQVIGTVVVAEGGGLDDWWRLILTIPNTGSSGNNPVFPAGYVFDFRTTTVTI